MDIPAEEDDDVSFMAHIRQFEPWQGLAGQGANVVSTGAVDPIRKLESSIPGALAGSGWPGC